MIVLFLFSLSHISVAQESQIRNRSDLLDQLGLLYDDENFEAITALETEIRSLFTDPDDSLAADAFTKLGDAFYYTYYFENAMEAFEKALAIIGTNKETDSEAYYNALINVTLAAIYTPDIEKNINYFEALLPLDKLFSGEESLEFQMTASQLGNYYMAAKRYHEAEALYASILKDLNRKSINYPVFLGNLGQVYSQMGDFRKAKKLLSQSLDMIIDSEGTQNGYYAGTLNAIASLYYYNGQYAESELLNFESNRIIEEIGAENFIDIYSSNLNLLGVTYTNMGLFDEAEQNLQQLEFIDQQVLGTDHPDYATTLNNLALLYTNRGNYDKADSLYTRSLAIREAAFGNQSLDYANSLQNLGLLYRKQGRFEASIDMYSRSRTIYQANYGTEHPQYATALQELGLSYFAADDYDQATSLLKVAAGIREKSLGKQHPRFGESMLALALLHWAEEEDEAAAGYFEELFDNYESQVNQFFDGLSEQEKASFFNNKLRMAYTLFNNFTINSIRESPELLGEVFDNQIATKGLILFATNRTRYKVLNSGDSILIDKYTSWIDTKDRLSKIFSQSMEDIEKSAKDIDSLTTAINQMEKELGVSVKDVGKPLLDKTVSWKDIQKKLGKNEAAMEIVRVREYHPEKNGSAGEEVYYLGLIITRKTKKHPDWVLLENGKALESRYLRSYRNAIKFKLEDEVSYGIFWHPFEDYLKGIEKIYITLDGVYNQVSLNTLYDPETGQFLIDKYDIQPLTNSGDIVALKRQGDQDIDGEAMLFGFPNYNMGMDQGNPSQSTGTEEKIDRGIRGMDRSLRGSLRNYIRGNNLLVMLPGTKTEVENIGNVYNENNKGALIFTEDDALESQMKIINNPSVLHIATHGFFLEDQHLPENSDDERLYQSPLLRSGLILAGVNHFILNDDALQNLGGEDGVFTAFEAINMNLEGTDVVVLSACETGLGDIINGEGVYGLQRAFQVAGAEAVIMSLWNVDDDATQELMSLFYKYWLETLDKRESFRRAQLDVRIKYPEPFFWGAFVMLGE